MISFLIKKRQEFSDSQKAKRVAKKLANTRHRLSSTTPLEAINGKLPKLLTGDIIFINQLIFRANSCGTSKFCLPDCLMTKSVHVEEFGPGARHIDIIYD